MEGLDDFTALKFKQLEIAQGSTILIYTRDRTDHGLAKKLRPEFLKVLISTEVKDCQKLIARITNDTKDEAPIDLILADFDLSIPKLVDFINKRPTLPESNLCPLVPIIILAKESSVKDVQEHLQPVGGATKVLGPPLQSQIIFNIILEVLHNRKQVEDTFNHIKKVPTKSAKYPFLGIFEARAPLKNKDAEGESKTSHSLIPSHAETTVEELDNASESSSMLPNYVKNVRREHPTLRNKYDPSEHSADQMGTGFNEQTKPGSAFPGILRRQGSSNRPSLATFKQRSSTRFNVADLQEIRNELKDTMEIEEPKEKLVLPDEQWDSVDLVNSNDARKGSLLLNREDSLDNLSTDEAKAEQLDAKGLKSKLALVGLQNETLLDPIHRPIWVESKDASRMLRRTGGSLVHDYASFIEKAPPSLSKVSTVSGLDRKACLHAWRTVKRPLTASTMARDMSEKGLTRVNTMQSMSSDIANHTPMSPPRSPHRNLSMQSMDFNLPDHGVPSIDMNDRAWMRKNGTNEAIAVFNTNTMHEQRDVNKMYRKIAQIAKQSTPDLQVSKLLDIDFSSRMINLGEKDMLERGLNLQNAGDLEAAAVYYTRAGAHSKDQQISKMLLGHVAYQSNKMLSALRYYDLAIRVIESKPAALRPVQDAFLGYFNRSIIRFRLGDDDDGVKDMELALHYDPNHLQAREILSLAKRRLGKYAQAIEDAIIHKNQKAEQHYKEMEEAQKKADEAQKKKLAVVRTGRRYSEDEDDGMNDRPQMLTAQSSRFTSSRRDETLQRQAQALKGIRMDVPESACHSSLRDRIEEHRSQFKEGEVVSDGSMLADGYLKLFKLQHNVKMELFDELFHKPTDLQTALLTEPARRRATELDAVANLLKFFPFFQSFSQGIITELAQSVEYRAITNPQVNAQNSKLFGQNQDPYAVCLLIKGHVHSRLDYSVHSSMANVALDDYYEYEVFGHIDYLFNSMNKALIRVIEDVLLVVPKGARHKDAPGNVTRNETDSLPSESSDDDSDVAMARMDENNEAHQILMAEMQNLASQVNAGTNTANTVQPPKLNRNNTGTNSGSATSTQGGAARAIRPGMFATYTMRASSELLLLSPDDYFRHLFQPALDEFRLRLETVKACGIFSRWRPEELVRLARMGSIQRKRRGTVILQQGTKPMHLFIIVKGMCVVKKKPNRTEMLLQKLEIAKERAHQHDLKYVFHHKPLLFCSETMKRMHEQNNTSTVTESVGLEEEDDHSVLSDAGTPKAKANTGMNEVSTPKAKASTPKTPKAPMPGPTTPHGMDRIPESHRPGSLSLSRSGSSDPQTPTARPKTPNNHNGAFSPATSPHHGNHHHHTPSSRAHTPSRAVTPSGRSSARSQHTPKKKVENNRAFNALPEMRRFSTSIDLAPSMPTTPERERKELAQEIQKLEDLIMQARIQDALELQHHRHGPGALRKASSEDMRDLIALTTPNAKPFSRSSVSMEPGDKEARELASSLGASQAEITTLQWPMIFGEACVLDPEAGISRGSIIADTSVDVFVLHKKQIQTFQIDDLFLDRVKGKGVVYPGDPDIVVNLYRQQEWGHYCKETMKDISTVRWPTTLKAHEPFNI